MLYATTRNHSDAYTAQRILTLKRGPDGGLFVPYKLPRLTPEEIAALGSRNFNGNLAGTLNLLLGSRLTSYDLDLALGRNSVRLQQLGQRLLMAECWHNTDWHFSRMVRDITELILTERNALAEPEGWAGIAVRIAVLAGIFGELIRVGQAGPDDTVDIACLSGDFSGPMAAWYARYMGLPVGNIVCCCNENAAIWDFICHGQLRTDGVARDTGLPEADILIPDGLERLISIYGGPEETERYVQCLRLGCSYYAEDSFLKRLRQGIYITVSSGKRIRETIPSAWATHRYLMGPASALTYAGLLDYRARTGEMRSALIMTEKSPLVDSDFCAGALGVPEQKLKEYM